MKGAREKKAAPKSGDIRSYFKAFASPTGGSSSSSSKESSAVKRKAEQLSEDEDFSGKQPEKQVPKKPDWFEPSPTTASKSSSSSGSSSRHRSKKSKEEESASTSKPSKKESSSEKEKRSPSKSKSGGEPAKDKAQQPTSSKEKAQETSTKDRAQHTSAKEKAQETSTKEKAQQSSSKDKAREKSREKEQKSGRSPSKGKPASSDAEKGKRTESPKKTESSDKHERVKERSVKKDSSPSPKKRSAANTNIGNSKEKDDRPPSKKKAKESTSRVVVTPAPKKPATVVDHRTPEATTPAPDEKKRQGSAGYFKFLSRGPPRNLGAKEFPEGAPGCFEGKTFVLSGVLPSFERDDVADVIKNYGGRVTSAVSKKTTYLLIGDEAGATKAKKAQDLGVSVISEDDFLDMLRKSNPNGTSSKTDEMEIDEDSDIEEPIPSKLHSKLDESVSIFEKSGMSEDPRSVDRKSPKKKFEDFHEFDSDLETPTKVRSRRAQNSSMASEPKTPTRSSSRQSPRKTLNFEAKPGSSPKPPEKVEKTAKVGKDASPAKEKSRSPTKPMKKEDRSQSPKKVAKTVSQSQPSTSRSATTSTSSAASSAPAAPPGPPPLMWVDKYKPKSLKAVVGQSGDRSNAKKLNLWLQNWFKYHGSANDKAKASWPGLRDPDGKTFKAALLSGPPGVGKTTTAHLCCQELGYDYYEMNASDQRNKKGLHEGISTSLTNTTIQFLANSSSNKSVDRHHVLIMDEVDGMSGNEDRGGVQELIALIKGSRIPIICICNDRNHQKIRSLANYCFDLRFTKPRNEQLKSFVQSICFKEKIKIPPEVIQQLIISTDQDVRQILHQLQMYQEGSTKNVLNPRKDLRLGPWDVVRKVFSSQDHVGMTLNDKASLFFQDYSFGPLFVQENYMRSIPDAARGDRLKTLDLVKATAESLALGDCVDNVIRKNNAWSLLPVAAIFSSVLPGEYMEGAGMTGIEFPQWLGKNSNRNKRARLLQEVYTHTHLQVSGSTEALNMDYLPYLRRAVVGPLAKGEIEEAAHVMTSYNLLRDDLESLNDLALWPNMRDYMSSVDSKAKASFTRLVNKESYVPYSVVKVTKAKGKGAAGGGAEGELEELGEDGETATPEDEEDNEDVEKDAMIKVKKPRAKPAAKAKGEASSSSGAKAKKGKGKRAKDSDEDEDSEEEVMPKKKGRAAGSSSKAGRGRR